MAMISSGKRKSAVREEVTFGRDDTKRRRKETRKTTGFKPTIPNSSDTPPEEDERLSIPPPPPSEKKIARRRSSVRQAQRRDSPSPSRLPPEDSTAKRQKTSHRSDMASASSSSSSSRARPSMPRPSSPPRAVDSSRAMAPPSTGFVRKTRKSMGFSTFEISSESVVPLAENETPMIKKNRELRDAQSRRSSLNMRGQRASSSLGRGEISMPHASVDSALFYKHIAPTMPEPIRARHVIAWCAKRALDAEVAPVKSKGKGKEKVEVMPRTEEGDRLLNEIMEDFIGSLGRGQVNTNVFGQKDAPPSLMTTRPHPRNVHNREIAQKEQIVINRCKEETRQWNSILNKANKRQHEVVNATRAKQSRDAEPDLAGTGWMFDALQLADRVIAEGDGDLSTRGEFEDVEFKIDSLHASSHVALQYSRQASRFLDGIFSSLAADLRSRDRVGLPTLPPHDPEAGPSATELLSHTRMAASASDPSATQRRDPMLMLRALASAELTEDAVVAAAGVSPVPQLNVSVGPGGGPGTSATPRRVGHTPRRTAQTPAASGTGRTPRALANRGAE